MLSLKRAFALMASLFIASCLAGPARAQQTGPYPAFTLVGKVTDYDAKGNAFPAYAETRYNSASGDWRYVGMYLGGQNVETLYRLGDGVYYVDHRGQRLLKVFARRADLPGSTTAAEFRADPNFSRTETVLGHVAYVLRVQEKGYCYVEETYYVPEIGRTPFKRVTTFKNGSRRVEEPVSLTFGEPDVRLVRGAGYTVIEQVRLSGRSLDGRFQSKPRPLYPAEAHRLGISGTVELQVSVDETGRVTSARVVSLPLPLLDEAALEAVYKARFSPAQVRGRPVKTAGVVTYEFTLPAVASN
ncbi:MAG TPA: energy transducer TonB [Pyrinomonadaceae bacterium]|nr:energy transducer TonB [Pyrinomonadaceae bacterium]